MTSEQIKEKALSLGYSACGIIPAEPFAEYKKALDERIAAFPQSKSSYKPLYGFVDPPESGKSIIVCIVGFNKYKVPRELAQYAGKHYLFDVRLQYAEEFRMGAEFETYLKNIGLRLVGGGVPDRWAAVKAGIAKFGRNNFIYSEQHGSYCLSLTWVVDKVLTYDAPPAETLAAECGGGCLACVDACPTKALCGELKMDYGKCIPCLANNTERLPDTETMEHMGSWIYGCDVCQDVCPMNKGKQSETEEFPLLRQYADYIKPEGILEMDEDTYKNVVNPRFWYVGEDGLWLWKCNALRVMINSGDEKYFPYIKKYSGCEDKRIAGVAKWGCDKLGL